MNRSECLDTAKDLITRERAKQYGGAYAMHQRVADMWNGYLSQNNLTLTVKDVAVMMILLKVARLRNVDTDKDPTVDGHDSFVDICGYAALGCELTSPTKD